LVAGCGGQHLNPQNIVHLHMAPNINRHRLHSLQIWSTSDVAAELEQILMPYAMKMNSLFSDFVFHDLWIQAGSNRNKPFQLLIGSAVNVYRPKGI
jgi:hypothetical protein